MILMYFAAAFLAVCTLGMFDMAQGARKRHGWRYASGEYMATGIMRGMTLTALLIAFEGI